MDSQRSAGGSALLAGVLMLVVGFFFGLVGNSDSQVYIHSVTVFNWMLRIGGGLLLAIGLLGLAGVRGVWLLDGLVSGLIGLGLAGIALIWLYFGDHFKGLLVGFYAAMCLSSAGRCWSAWQRMPAGPPPAVDPSPTAISPPPADRLEHIAPPADDEPIPEGFLAELGREARSGPAKPRDSARPPDREMRGER